MGEFTDDELNDLERAVRAVVDETESERIYDDEESDWDPLER